MGVTLVIGKFDPSLVKPKCVSRVEEWEMKIVNKQLNTKKSATLETHFGLYNPWSRNDA